MGSGIRPALIAIALLMNGVRTASGAEGERAFIRGDVDQTGNISVTDAVHIVSHVLRLDSARCSFPVYCEDAADANDDGAVNVADAVYLLEALFRGGPVPPGPFPECGYDPTEDALGCAASGLCEPLFYGQELEFDSLFFVIEASPVMWESGELERAKREVQVVVQGLRAGSEFGIFFFASTGVRFPESLEPAVASRDTLNQALAFLRSVPRQPGTCPRQALEPAIEMAKRSRGPRKVLFFVGTGQGTCQGADEWTYLKQTLASITALNHGEVTIHTIGILDPEPFREIFLKDLAESNGGRYTRVP